MDTGESVGSSGKEVLSLKMYIKRKYKNVFFSFLVDANFCSRVVFKYETRLTRLIINIGGNFRIRKKKGDCLRLELFLSLPS